jgi:RNA polymerase sigma-32 factor
MVPPIGNLDAYISAVNRLPLLTQEEETDFARKLRDSGDIEAAGRLVLSHLRLVVSVSRQYLGYGLPHGDLIQEGNVGLMKAVKRFDPEQGRAAGELRAALDQGRDPRVHPEELAHGQGGHHQGPAQAVLQPALDEAGHEGRSRRRRHAPQHAACRDRHAWRAAERQAEEVIEMETRLAGGDVLLEPQTDDDGEESYAPIAYLADEAQRADPRARSPPSRQLSGDGILRALTCWTSAAAASSKSAG